MSTTLYQSPYPGSLGETGHLNPRDRMRLAKLALLQDEEREGEVRKERRRSRRASSIAAQYAGGRHSKGGLSMPGMPESEIESAVPSPVRSFRKLPPYGILRQSLPALDADANTDEDGLHSLEPRSATRLLTPGNGSLSVSDASADQKNGAYARPARPQAARRSSRVRFEEESSHAEVTTAEPGSTNLDQVQTSREDDAGHQKPNQAAAVIAPRAESPLIITTSGMDQQEPMETLIEGSTPTDMSTLSSDRVVTPEQQEQAPPVLSRQGSVASISTVATDPFGLQSHLGSPVAAQSGSFDSAGEEIFKPQPLPYKRLSKVLARLQQESDVIGSLESLAPSLPNLKTEQLHDEAGPNGSGIAAYSSEESPVTPRSARSSFAISISATTPVRYSLTGTSFASAGSTLTSQSGSFSSSSIYLPPRMSTVRGAAYATLLPLQVSSRETDAQTLPEINRQPFVDDMGFSPRSGAISMPSHARSMSALELSEMVKGGSEPTPQAQVELGPALSSPKRDYHLDSIDMLPQVQEPAESVLEAYTALGIKAASKVKNMPEPAVVAFQKGHKREDSDLGSVDISFPIPPDRLNISLGKLVTPTVRRNKPSMSLAPSVRPVSATVELAPMAAETEANIAPSLVAVGDFEAFASPNMVVPAASPRSTMREAVLREALAVQASPCPDAYSLTAAVLQVGTPTSEKSGLAHSPTVSVHSRLSDSAGPPRPDSPDLQDMIRSLRERRSTCGFNFDISESDLDVSTPLVEVALKSQILSPTSRLLSGDKTRPPVRRVASMSPSDLKSGVGLTKGMGWSGSESEEEEWAQAIRSVKQRKSTKRVCSTPALSRIPVPKSSSPTPASRIPIAKPSSPPSPSVQKAERGRPLPRPPTRPTDRMSHTSTASEISGTTAVADTTLATPSASLFIPKHKMMRTASSGSTSSSSTLPGKFAWGRSSPSSPHRALYSALIDETKPKSPKLQHEEQIGGTAAEPSETAPSRAAPGIAMPMPLRHEDWGEPEIMIDESGDEGWNLVSHSPNMQDKAVWDTEGMWGGEDSRESRAEGSEESAQKQSSRTILLDAPVPVRSRMSPFIAPDLSDIISTPSPPPPPAAPIPTQSAIASTSVFDSRDIIMQEQDITEAELIRLRRQSENDSIDQASGTSVYSQAGDVEPIPTDVTYHAITTDRAVPAPTVVDLDLDPAEPNLTRLPISSRLAGLAKRGAVAGGAYAYSSYSTWTAGVGANVVQGVSGITSNFGWPGTVAAARPAASAVASQGAVKAGVSEMGVKSGIPRLMPVSKSSQGEPPRTPSRIPVPTSNGSRGRRAQECTTHRFF